MGHFIPGIFFIILGSVEGINVFSSSNKKTLSKSLTRWRATVQLSTLSVHILGEIFTGFDSDWKFVNWGNLHHIVMLTFFCLSALMDLVNGLQAERKWFLLALLVELFVFIFHSDGERMNALEMRCHTYLSIGISLCVIALGFLIKEENHETSFFAVTTLIFQGKLLLLY